VPIQQNVAWAEAYCHVKFDLNPCNRLATIQCYRQTGQDRQWSDSIGRTGLQTCTQKVADEVTCGSLEVGWHAPA